MKLNYIKKLIIRFVLKKTCDSEDFVEGDCDNRMELSCSAKIFWLTPQRFGINFWHFL